MATRIPYEPSTGLRNSDTLVIRKRGGGERQIPSGKWWINRNTPVGEDASAGRIPSNLFKTADGRIFFTIHN